MTDLKFKPTSSYEEIFKDYNSPITMIYDDFAQQIIRKEDNAIMYEVRRVIDIDKKELIKALNYDRQQYEQGYKAGYYKGFSKCQEERKHGHWEEDEDKDIYCTNCKHYLYPAEIRMQQITLSSRRLKRKICPECGAIMDEREEQNNDSN